MTRFMGLTRTATAACAAAVLAAGCSGGPSQTAGAYAPTASTSSLRASAATYRPMVNTRGVMSQLPQGLSRTDCAGSGYAQRPTR